MVGVGGGGGGGGGWEEGAREGLGRTGLEERGEGGGGVPLHRVCFSEIPSKPISGFPCSSDFCLWRMMDCYSPSNLLVHSAMCRK